MILRIWDLDHVKYRVVSSKFTHTTPISYLKSSKDHYRKCLTFLSNWTDTLLCSSDRGSVIILTFAEHLKHCLKVDHFHFIFVFKVKDQTFVMLSMGKSILTFFFFSSGFGPDLRIDRARASPNRPISTGSKTGTFATWKAQAWLELRLRCSDHIEMVLKNKKEFDPLGQPEHHLDGWVVECCHQGEEGRVREEAVLHCTPRIWMPVYVWYSKQNIMLLGPGEQML